VGIACFSVLVEKFSSGRAAKITRAIRNADVNSFPANAAFALSEGCVS
jgi:hypothetical protein